MGLTGIGFHSMGEEITATPPPIVYEPVSIGSGGSSVFKRRADYVPPLGYILWDDDSEILWDDDSNIEFG